MKFVSPVLMLALFGTLAITATTDSWAIAAKPAGAVFVDAHR